MCTMLYKSTVCTMTVVGKYLKVDPSSTCAPAQQAGSGILVPPASCWPEERQPHG